MTTDRSLRLTRSASRSLSTDGVRQIIMGYRGGRHAAVDPDWTPKPGMLYTQVRAISARINQNYDAWPSEELKKSYRTFLGKPVFVNHANEDPEKARGKVIAARYVEAGDDKYVEVIQEVDAARFPKLAREIREGGLDSVSMGVEAGLTKCSYCGNTATDEPEFCEHVRHHKGEYLPRKNTKTGKTEDVLVYENCYKLGFFELSYVFEPADETAVVSRVIAASRHQAGATDDYLRALAEDPGAFEQPRSYENPGARRSPEMQRWLEQQSRRDRRMARRRTAYGEIEAPEDIDTLREDDGESFEDYQFVEPIGHEGEEDQDDSPFQHYLESPQELQAPDLGATKRLDREQEDEGLDADRRVEDVEGIMPEDQAAMAAQQGRQAMARRNRRRRVANDDAALIDQAVQELEQYEAEQGGGDAGGDPFAADEGYGDDGDADYDGYTDGEDADDDEDGHPEDADGYDEDGDGSDEDFSGDPMGDEEMYEGDGEGLDPRYDDPEAEHRMARRYRWAADAVSGPGAGSLAATEMSSDASPVGGPQYNADVMNSAANMASDFYDAGQPEGANMPASGDFRQPTAGLKRRYEASCRQRGVRPTNAGFRRFLATVGQQSSPKNRRGKGNAMGTLANRGRVAAKGRMRHFADDNGYTDGGPYGDDASQGVQEEVFISQVPPAEEAAVPVPGDGTISNNENTLVARKMQKRIKAQAAELQRNIRAYRKFAEECCDDNIIEPCEVNPGLSASDDDDLKGDFESVQPDAVPTQPKDASVHVFRNFDNWLRSTTGRTAAQHGNANFIRRQAASYAKAAGVPLDRMFPTLDRVLRQARNTEQARRAAMKRRADELLDVAAPQDRIDVEAPVANITDERAQASQYDLGEYGNNAGDDIADPNLDTSSQIWAPGEGTKSANRKADAVAAVRYAEAYIRAGLPHRDKWTLVAQAQTMRHATVVDRTRVLEAVVESNTKRARSQKVAAAVSRGTNGLPRGLTAPRTASTQRTAANDPSNDIGIWL